MNKYNQYGCLNLKYKYRLEEVEDEDDPIDSKDEDTEDCGDEDFE